MAATTQSLRLGKGRVTQVALVLSDGPPGPPQQEPKERAVFCKDNLVLACEPLDPLLPLFF